MKFKRIPYKKYWKIKGRLSPSLKHNRNHAGMAYTAARSDHPLKRKPTLNDKPSASMIRDSARLRSAGTLDVLRGGISARYHLESKQVYSLKRPQPKRKPIRV